MSEKTFPLSALELQTLTEKYETPFYLYDEKAIRENIRRFTKAFSIFPGFKEHFAVKACPNPYILKILRSEGCGADCSSLPELILAENAGIAGEDVMFTSNETPAKEYIYANLKGNIINLDDITHIPFLEKTLGFLPEILSFRYNPGPLKEGNAIIGKPEEAKYGLTEEQIFEAYKICKEKGVKRFGLHTMVASNELNPDYFVETATLLFNLAAKVKEKVGITFEFVNLGGGLGIPYRPGDKAVDYDYIARGIKDAYDAIVVPAGLDPLKIYWECGRPITGPYGWLVTRAIHEKHIYRDYIGVDASMADLMRPGMYGAYHEVTVSGKENAPKNKVYDVVGSLCENCDKFAVQRQLPEIQIGDLLIIHDAGAHGRAMGFNYNAKLRCGELLLRQDGSVVEIRRRETIDDYFATLDFKGLSSFNV
ncbi:MAG: diaminopimelate decarboxylase [Candidatus Treponema excrementipullorum]|uniref:Diaminopimelate decarboxylase n=1 Tax=Candidatus Treponema excrementipullorum TaxID=2838768 RepID=A0A9E2L1B7_9SPIR|nr:diaminopimelate decarboxylase [Candidatus Treponema excrementipullorum]